MPRIGGARWEGALPGGESAIDLSRWIEMSSGGASLRSIAKRMGRSPDSLSRWVRSGKMPAEAIIQFSRLYDADLLAGALAGGVIRAEDIERAMPQVLRQAATLQLTAELHRRAGG